MINNQAIRIGLGIRGISAAVILGLICLYQPLLGEATSTAWAKILLVLAAAIYVIFALVWDRKHVPLTIFQLIAAIFLLFLTISTGKILFVAIGLLAHAIWDFWHLVSQKNYVPWWYAGACIYVDLAAAILILMN